MTSHDNVTDIVPRATAEWEGIHFTDCEVEVEQYEWARKYARPLLTEVATLRKQLENARSEALEEAAKVVDQCNREGPYNAIGAAKRIRALKGHT